MFSAAEKAGAAAIMPWELVPWHVAPTASGGFDFGIDDESFAPAVQMVNWMKTRVLPLLTKQDSCPQPSQNSNCGCRSLQNGSHLHIHGKC